MPNIPLSLSANPAARRAFAMHDRTWHSNRYVYPVVSRRSKGISIGINLNPDKVCNFDCIYCSVDRTLPQPQKVDRNVELFTLRNELAAMLDLVYSGNIYRQDPFDKIPDGLRRLNDIAFSGDGEPATCPQFDQAVRTAAELKHAAALQDVKLVLITNATQFHKPAVREILAFLDQHNGEIWAKLDAGTPGYYALVDRSSIPFDRLLQNLNWCCQTRPTVIQTLLMQIHNTAPTPAEIIAYATRLAEIITAGGKIKLIQLYTVARHTTETYATPLSADALQKISELVCSIVPHLPVEIYP